MIPLISVTSFLSCLPFNVIYMLTYISLPKADTVCLLYCAGDMHSLFLLVLTPFCFVYLFNHLKHLNFCTLKGQLVLSLVLATFCSCNSQCTFIFQLVDRTSTHKAGKEIFHSQWPLNASYYWKWVSDYLQWACASVACISPIGTGMITWPPSSHKFRNSQNDTEAGI